MPLQGCVWEAFAVPSAAMTTGCSSLEDAGMGPQEESCGHGCVSPLPGWAERMAVTGASWKAGGCSAPPLHHAPSLIPLESPRVLSSQQSDLGDRTNLQELPFAARWMKPHVAWGQGSPRGEGASPQDCQLGGSEPRDPQGMVGRGMRCGADKQAELFTVGSAARPLQLTHVTSGPGWLPSGMKPPPGWWHGPELCPLAPLAVGRGCRL